MPGEDHFNRIIRSHFSDWADVHGLSPGSLADTQNKTWQPTILDGGTRVVWTNNGATGNYGDTRHAFGFSVTSPTGIDGIVAVTTDQFCSEQETDSCIDIDIDATAVGPVSPAAGGAAGALAQYASGAGWGMLFALLNSSEQPANAHLNFFDNNGNDQNVPQDLLVPPSNVLAAITSTLSSFDQALPPGKVLFLQSNASNSLPQPLVGWAKQPMSSTASGFGIFQYPASKWEALVPLETRNATRYILAFDNTGNLSTGVAVANLGNAVVNITVILRDENGVQIGAPQVLPPLAAGGHTSFLLNSQFPDTSAKRGTAEFLTPAGGRIAVLGLRANTGALTTIPVLANVGTNGGSITHFTLNGGFTSVLYIVNTGTTNASFTLTFYTEAGAPLSVPLTVSQAPSPIVTSGFTRSLDPGAMMVVETQAQDGLATVQGSAILTTTGNVSGFEVFRWTTYGQEASVPMETRTPDSHILVYDNINPLTTGVALANLQNLETIYDVVVHDEDGAVLETDNILLPPFGHMSFMLPNQYSESAGRRGWVEFVVPNHRRLSVLGLRATSDGTLTTIPTLPKYTPQ